MKNAGNIHVFAHFCEGTLKALRAQASDNV
jgi:hypothetical protein